MTIRWASTFLSHSSVDKPFVEAVAAELGRRGVLAWLDKSELSLGPLDVSLKEAVTRNATLTLFLSNAAIKSEWIKDELRFAFEAGRGDADIYPVYLGEPLPLVKDHPLLRSRFLHADGDRVKQLGAASKGDPADRAEVIRVAEEIAKAVFQRVLPTWTEVVVALDQRGDGPRKREPDVPENIERMDMPGLVFRPSRAPRSQKDLLLGSDWTATIQGMKWGLSNALGTVRGAERKVRVCGNAQTSLWWAVGTHFDRTTTADIFAVGRAEDVVTNRGQERWRTLQGGDATRGALIQAGNTAPNPRIAFGVGDEKYQPPAKGVVDPKVPLYWLKSGHIKSQDEAMELVRDVVACLESVAGSQNATIVELFWASGAHIAPLAAANVTSHVISKVEYWEFDHNTGTYHLLEMPRR
jgi:hypothetical protein